MMEKLRGELIAAIAILAIISYLASLAGAVCPTCGGIVEDWDKTATNFLAGITSEEKPKILSSPQISRTNYLLSNNPSNDRTSSSFSQALVPISGAQGFDIILDISPETTEYIPDAVSIPYTKFLKDNLTLKPVADIAKILGEAGISQDDSLLIYGECQPCGGGPSASTYMYWIMKYLGHGNVKLLDGGIKDWIEAKNPTASEPKIPAKTNYAPKIKPELLATYEYVKSGQAQILDARTTQEFAAGSIPGAINIPYDSVIQDGKIRDEATLKEIFGILDKNKPVVIYTNTGVKASMVWFVLNLMGYDARLYSYQDWADNQPKLEISLKEVKVEPNPGKNGDIIKITAIFAEANRTKGNKTTNETILTIKGCATCGFGSPQGFADITQSGNNTGVVQIGYSAHNALNAALPQDTFRCIANIISPTGDLVSKVNMKRVSDDIFSGIWNANVAPGNYSVTIIASTPDASKTFQNVLNIEVQGTTGKYKNLG
ncbi:MAG: sulfurtransferase [Methanotrichaceae archaeon]|nr:sulfurtransferase [Methanotrichaceae archaeon]MDD1757128.1 sulfurtransferase [Methanotrichaceae archaeon]